MRKEQKKMALNFVQTLYQAHEQMKCLMESHDEAENSDLHDLCQQGADALCNLIRQTEGDDCSTIEALKQYKDAIYRMAEQGKSIQPSDIDVEWAIVNEHLNRIEDNIRYDIEERTEVVFLPYQASMWDSLESVWKDADADKNCDAYVIPIPYYDRNPDGSFGTEHWEWDQYPDYVPITKYNTYDFARRKPDIIFIHNPYDDCNRVTSIHPYFYSDRLKQHTDKLVYIPYFVLEEISPDNQAAVKGMEHFCTVPAVINADEVIVQSENMRQIYINVLTEAAGGDTRQYWENKILGTGSPKFDKILKTKKEGLNIPEEWMRKIRKKDGSWKKIVFYNTSVVALLKYRELFIEKIQNVLDFFNKNQDEITLLWRPHPLMTATFESTLPQLKEDYQKLVERYLSDDWGIYDDSKDLDRAVVLCDGYYGDKSSVVQLCQAIGKPVLIQNVNIREEQQCNLN